jgi:hypothetical protein
MERIYHEWDKWECYEAGFFSSLIKGNKQELTDLCISLYKNQEDFKFICNSIIKEWKYSCEHNLTNDSLNKIAWLGQSACAKKFGICSDISREAFNHLNVFEQGIANGIADNCIKEWEAKHVAQDI